MKQFKKWQRRLVMTALCLGCPLVIAMQGPVMISQPKPKPKPFFVMIKGDSLRLAMTDAAHKAGWKQVVWRASMDYRWYGSEKIVGQDLADVFKKLLRHYPLQAVFYQANHVLVIHTTSIT